jgi:hypothetical protein
MAKSDKPALVNQIREALSLPVNVSADLYRLPIYTLQMIGKAIVKTVADAGTNAVTDYQKEGAELDAAPSSVDSERQLASDPNPNGCSCAQ